MNDFKFEFEFPIETEILRNRNNENIEQEEVVTSVSTSTSAAKTISLLEFKLLSISMLEALRLLMVPACVVNSSTTLYRAKKRFIIEKDDNSLNDLDDKISNIMKCSDLQSGVYEGGFKVWECSIDLVRFLSSEEDNSSCSSYFAGKKVLELGCGHGLPGIYALKCGSTVHFQDFNSEVIEQLTIPNVIANCFSLAKLDESIQAQSQWQRWDARTKFFSGDWISVNNLMKMKKETLNPTEDNYEYDLILSSDTLYDPHYYIRLCEFIEDHLKDSQNSFAYPNH